ncbi:hypothetical protein CYMTET_29766, partial [Cymbomonas tetramitiformis]
PSETFRRMFPAQVFKESVMASVCARRISEGDKVLCIAQHVHGDFGYGVPERVLKLHPPLRKEKGELQEKMVTITTRGREEPYVGVLPDKTKLSDLLMRFEVPPDPDEEDDVPIG